jgi:hypothetical protein
VFHSFPVPSEFQGSDGIYFSFSFLILALFEECGWVVCLYQVSVEIMINCFIITVL